ncbi:hypothetical protein FOA52_006787 [Chlamydomonas sp. UWO 241]|nr:hypothetical protein FOA52_006787 [Chlamydomonas sp. UWO 241]
MATRLVGALTQAADEMMARGSTAAAAQVRAHATALLCAAADVPQHFGGHSWSEASALVSAGLAPMLLRLLLASPPPLEAAARAPNADAARADGAERCDDVGAGWDVPVAATRVLYAFSPPGDIYVGLFAGALGSAAAAASHEAAVARLMVVPGAPITVVAAAGTVLCFRERLVASITVSDAKKAARRASTARAMDVVPMWASALRLLLHASRDPVTAGVEGDDLDLIACGWPASSRRAPACQMAMITLSYLVDHFDCEQHAAFLDEGNLRHSSKRLQLSAYRCLANLCFQLLEREKGPGLEARLSSEIRTHTHSVSGIIEDLVSPVACSDGEMRYVALELARMIAERKGCESALRGTGFVRSLDSLKEIEASRPSERAVQVAALEAFTRLRLENVGEACASCGTSGGGGGGGKQAAAQGGSSSAKLLVCSGGDAVRYCSRHTGPFFWLMKLF